MPHRARALPQAAVAAGFRLPKLVLMVSALITLVLVSVLLLPGHAKPADSAAGHLRIATWNMCDVRQWNCQDTGSSRQKIQALTQLAGADGAGVIMLQEVCAGDLRAARKELGKEWRSTFREYAYRDVRGRYSAVRCTEHGQGAAGIAILAMSALSRVSLVPTQQPAVGLHRGILCATITDRDVRVCNAHLSLPGSDRAHPSWELRDDQLKSLVGAAGSRTVFGGDMNSAAPAAWNKESWIWPHDTYRRYRECDQKSASSRSGRATHRTGHKVDYLFTDLPRTHCSVRDTGASDHLALVMRVRTGCRVGRSAGAESTGGEVRCR